MISPTFKINQFLDAVREMSYHDILRAAEREVYDAEQGSYGIKGAVKRRERGSTRYAAELKMFLFFMRYHVKPSGISEALFAAFAPVCQSLVLREEFGREAMDIFGR